MRASVAAAWPAVCSAFEGRCWFMYLDTKKKVTTGIGFLVDSVAAAQKLPWHRVSDGGMASNPEIETEWRRVKALTRLAPSGGFAYRPSAKLRLPEADIDRLLMDMTASWWSAMLAQWPELESWPADAQLGYLDEAWQNGKYFTASWPDTRAGFKAMDFHKAAGAVPGSGTRAAFRKRLFNNAAVVMFKDIDREILWDKKVPVANVVPADPPVIPNPGPIAQPGVRPKPLHGSKSEKVYADKWGMVVDKSPFLTTTRTLAMWQEAVHLYHQAGGVRRPYWTQGGYNAGGKVSASAGTHNGDACDTSIRDDNSHMTAREKALWESATWAVGFAGWIRLKLTNIWPEHWHGIPKGGDISRGAEDQVKQFKNARNGLFDAGMYSRIARQGVGSWTWEDYLTGWGVSLSGLLEAFEDGKVREDVKDLQWALTRYLGTDVIGDGQLGPQTKAALAKVGPLDTASLTKLGLEVNP